MAPGRRKVDKAEPKPKRGRRSLPDADNEDEDVIMDSDDSLPSPSKKAGARGAKKKAPVKPTPKKTKAKGAQKDTQEEEEDADDFDERRQLLEENINEEDLLNMVIPPPPEAMKEGDANKRLMISSIEVENFKSYYGKQVIGPFHKNFTAIIGPNGSGKSNVIDSLLFVFGYRAAKIRSKKVSVLIHNSAAHDNIDRCRVQVNFQQIIDEPEGKYSVVPGSQFSVARTGFRNNSSQYHYNGTPMQFKEVAKILRNVGIDLIHNRFLILQGEVEQISLMKPKAPSPNEDGMLEYLEDIIGCARLKVPIEKLTAKCSQLQDQRTTQFSRAKQAEREKEALENPVRDIMQHLRLENGIALVNSKALYKKMYKKEAQYEEHAPQVDVIKEKIKENKEQMSELLKLQDEQSKEQKKLQKKLEKAEDEFSRSKTSQSTMEGEVQLKKKELKRCAEKVEKLKADIKKEDKKLKEYESQPAKCEQKIEEHTEIAEEAKQEELKYQKMLEERLVELEGKSKELNERKKAHEAELAAAAKAQDSASSKLLVAQQDRKNLVDEGERAHTQLKELESNIAETERNLEAKKGELEKVKTALPGKVQALQESETRAREVEERVKKLEAACHPLQAKVMEERSSCSSQSQNRVIAALMREKEKGTIQGIYGRLGDLGGIDKKYDAAISNCTGVLDNVVVENVEVAQQCIKFLKEQNIGTVTFLALNKQDRFKGRMKLTRATPEGAPRLFDLITVKDEKVLPAFYFCLQDTLFAEDINAATRIAFTPPRWRVATANGEIVETGGTMVGGGSRVVRGKMGATVRVDTSRRRSGESLEELEQKLKSLKAEIEELERESGNLNRQIHSLTRDKEQMERRAKDLDTEIDTLTLRLERLRGSLVEQKEKVKNSKRTEQAVDEATDNVRTLEKDRDEAAATVDKIRSQVEEINKQLQDFYTEIVGDIQTHFDAARERKDAALKVVSKEQTALNAVSRNLSKSQKKVAELNKDLERTEESIVADEEKIKDLEEQLEALALKIEELEKVKVEAQEEVNEANEKAKSSNEDEIKLKNEGNMLDKSLKELTEKLTKIRYEIERYKGEIAKLTFQYVTFVDRLPAELTAPDGTDEILSEAYTIEMEAIKSGKTKKGKAPRVASSSDDPEPMETDGEEVPAPESEDEEEEGAPMVSVTTMIGTLEIPAPTKEAMEMLTEEELKFHQVNLDKKKVKKNYDFNNLVEYYHKLLKFEKENAELEEISKKRDAHRDKLKQVKDMRHNEFMDGFQKIGSALKEMYQMITLGGDASLDLVDSLDPFNEGVSFGVRPPKKSWKQITNLSGGEKTLSSLALVFALHHYKPTPLYVMDEIDAALDFRNVSIIGHYIKEKTKNAQFIIISLRNNMFELGDRLVGIYKTYDCTKNVCVDPDEVAKAAQDVGEKLRKNRADRRVLSSRQDV
uniref:Structural maintenance of chromosomes protein n=1 Tax=Steinernema glaseri TaxID=37863 RepID=A0A1I7XYB7_9BILA